MHPSEIKIDGAGRVSVAPDAVRLTLSISALEPDYPRALATVNRRTEALQTALRGAGVAHPAETTSYGIAAQWANEYDADKRKFMGHRASHALEVTIPFDQALLGRVVSALSGGEAKPGLRTQFVVQDLSAHVRTARDLAMRNAEAAASELASVARLRLDGIRSITYRAVARQSPGLQVDLDGMVEFEAIEPMNVTPAALMVEESVSVVWAALAATA